MEVDFGPIFDAIRGEGGVIALLLFLFVVFFRGGVVTGKAYEKMDESHETRHKKDAEEIVFWRDKALRALEVGERVVSDDPGEKVTDGGS